MMNDQKSRKVDISEFWKAVHIFLLNLHVLKKNFAGSCFLSSYNVQAEAVSFLSETALEEIANFGKLALSDNLVYVPCSNASVEQSLENTTKLSDNHHLIYVARIATKDAKNFIIIFTLDFSVPVITSFSKNSPYSKYFTFSASLVDGEIVINSETADKSAIGWLEFYLRPKFYRWSKNCTSVGSSGPRSLSIVCLTEYNKLYLELKQKYGSPIIEMWTEVTDPKKFVYEDIGIATYLIILWKNNKRTSFVDLGCGNGLLVHILCSEGFAGYGVDLRRRKIWDKFPKTTILKETAINPNEGEVLITEAEWIIGNHSDELSPWIPVIAALSSFNAKYFLLPCCAYEFSGSRYQRRDSKTSVYNDFLKYMRIISETCGFITLFDRLKIPSTKRIALIGIERKFPEREFDKKCTEIRRFLNNQHNINQIKIREKIEPVRNCTKLDKNISQDITIAIFSYLLTLENVSGREFDDWHQGGIESLPKIIQVLPKHLLINLKSQCGGLQTFLKMKHEVFLLQGSSVQIRRPAKIERNSNRKIQQRDCFFYYHHPNGCPLSMEECSFKHPESNIME